MSAMPLTKPTLDRIQLAHAKQLAHMTVDLSSPEERPPFDQRLVINWITANAKAITAAKSSQCKSTAPGSPNWDAVLFSLVESAAVYLRKQDSMHKAVDAARRGEFDRAVNYIKEAQEYVDVVARALDCTFVQLCDFTKRYPDGTWLHNGAYCGAFISNSTAKPFIGMAFKGTNSTRELVTDLDWTPLKPDQPGVAFDSKTHRGFYLGLFGRYKNASGGPDVPFELMIKQLDLVYNEHQRSVLHFTGYSLGGAYCTLTYGEFLRRTLRYTFGDMYSLAAPRVCELPFATEVFNRTKPGNGKYIFRIVYRKDPVPTVPPRTKSQLGQYRFTHVDGGWQLFPSEGPKVMRSERPPNNPVDPESIPSSIWNITDHKVQNYYEGWQRTPHS